MSVLLGTVFLDFDLDISSLLGEYRIYIDQNYIGIKSEGRTIYMGLISH
jgi:hypothetical protein